MLRSISKIFCGIILAVLFSTCNTADCTNTNPIFDRYPPESREYRNELYDKITKKQFALHYWFNMLRKENGNTMLHVNVKGGDLCAIMVIKVGKADARLEEIIKAGGKGYFGAELRGLNYISVSNGIGNERETQFLYWKTDKIVN